MEARDARVAAEPASIDPTHHVISHSQSYNHLHNNAEQYQAPQQQQHQHEMYVIPTEYLQQQQQQQQLSSSPESISPSTSTYSEQSLNHYRSPESVLAASHAQAQPAYWASTASTITQLPNASYQTQEEMYYQQPVSQVAQHHYRAGDAMRGIAAQDPSLQETWQSYMYKASSFHAQSKKCLPFILRLQVGSPRLMFED